MNFFHHKDLGNHLLQLYPKVVKHSVYETVVYWHVCDYNKILLGTKKVSVPARNISV